MLGLIAYYLGEILKLLMVLAHNQQIMLKELRHMAQNLSTLPQSLQSLQDTLAEVESADVAVEQVVTTLVDEVAALKTASTDPTTAAAIDNYVAGVRAKTQALKDTTAAALGK